MICFERLHEAWGECAELPPRSYQVGPFTLQITSNDPIVFPRLTRAFQHLASNSKAADLKLRIWSGSKLPPLNWSLIQTNGYRGYAEPPFYFHYFETIGALSAIDVEQGIAYYVIRTLDQLPWWASASPMQAILHVWLREKGMQMTHSACIANKTSAILLAGKGGSGKSTTVLACLEEGLDTLGEDYVVLSTGRAYSVYQTAKWQPHTRCLFPSYESHIANRDTANREKALVHYLDLFPSQIVSSSPIHAVVSLRIGNSTRLESSDLRTSLQSLVLTTAMQLPHPDPRTADLISKAIESLAHYQLCLGPNLKENVHVLKSLLR